MSRPFADVLRELNGDAYDELTLQLGEVVQAVMKTGKAGSLSLSLKVAANGTGSVTITDDIKVKVPEAARPKTMFFATESGSLMRNNPRQHEMQLRDVADTAETREARHA
ncbi:hypothetical protein BV511_07635 [Methylorubrum extorquens]|uniref:hypothetical protein n=1 Tax=Methylorubrum extorquens TaxID=408 RepID=UPI0009728F1D|nr:hypothetical protein [Methylorubrum extorquens]APX84593.1 hypothetical protein BV511_07635 [Methylorubrum extorquens]